MTAVDTAVEGVGSLPEAAHAYALRGWHVLPLRAVDKLPATAHGVSEATSDIDRVGRWWRDMPAANIGISAGPSGLVIIDVDPRNGGDVDQWLRLLDAAPTLSCRTGGGGLHLYYTAPEDVTLGVTLPGYPGVDVQRDKKYAVAPPSVHPTGPLYEWVDENIRVAPLPPWIVDLAKVQPPKLPTEGAILALVPEDSPMAWYNAYGDLDALLIEAGYTLHKVDAANERYWHRPGGENDYQVSTNYHGTGTLYSWSPETVFPVLEPISPFRAFAIVKHGGDEVEAASYIRLVLMDKPRITAWNPPEEEPEPEYSFEPAFRSDHWVGQYVAYASSMTDAPLEYHEAGALAALACVTYGNKLELAPFPHGLSTNLYIALVGPSTRSRKSTSQQIALDILEAARPDTVLPTRASSEALMVTLSMRNGMAAVWAPDELGVALGETYRVDYLSALEELLLTLYDGTEYHYITRNDSVHIHDVSVNVLGAATPESITLAGQRAALGGLLPRIGIVYPETLPDAQPVAGRRADPEPLVDSLRGAWAYARGSSHLPMSIDGDALVLLNAAEGPLTEDKHTARLPVMLYKVAALSALARMSHDINLDDADSAVKVITRWAAGAERLQPFMRRKAGNLEFEHALEDVLAILREWGGSVVRPRLAREVRLERSLLTRIRDTLADRAHIDVVAEDALETWIVK